ncbi:MAG: AAA family ATPase, partial [Bacteroidota bacterium]
GDRPLARFALGQRWLQGFVDQTEDPELAFWVPEAAWLLLEQEEELARQAAPYSVSLEGLHGAHSRLADGQYNLNYYQFVDRLATYRAEVVPLFLHFHEQKRHLSQTMRERMRLSEFEPRVLSSFVRNKLIDSVYLPMIGDNLAKQIGTAGEQARTDRMGMLLLISPPGYGKTTLLEYIANRLGMIFMKINGPAIGHDVTSTDPATAPNLGARQELEKLNLAFEMGDNVMIYLDDIQHCHPEFLQKFISLCDGQRKIEGVWQGQAKTYDFRGKRVSVVMAGNPYTESGDRFQIPDMLANRADVFNLGDMIGQSEAAFKMSYLENAAGAHPIVREISRKSIKDLRQLIGAAEGTLGQSPEFEADHSPDTVQDALAVMQHLLLVRDVILKVNQQYIKSATIADENREVPSFQLQGSYRNMNKLTEKVVPILNRKELETMILDHYVAESQTLTSGGEANLLQFKRMLGWQNEEESARWERIVQIFLEGQQQRNGMVPLLRQMETFNTTLASMRDWLEKTKK